MIAKLWAKRILAGEKTIADVPAQLLQQVKQELLNMLNNI